MATSEQLQEIKRRFGIVGNAEAYNNALTRALQVAPYNLSVLIAGESGAGKEHFPQIIHFKSPRRLQRYLSINCGAFPEGTINSELFGHVKGAFTDASRDHKGYFEEANGGTLFLDEVAEMPLATQALLLRVLESGEYLRVGDSEVRKTDVRIVAATNKDLMAEVKAGRFREDLYYRLSTVQINVPPLRSRGNDIWLLTRKFSNSFADHYRTPEVTYTDDAKQALLNYRWPGNVRQLKNVIEQIALFYAGSNITADVVRSYCPAENGVAIAGDSAQFDYAKDREYIIRMMFKMQRDIEMLQQHLADIHHDGNVASVHLNDSTAELVRQSMPAAYDSFNDHYEPKYEMAPQAIEVDTSYVEDSHVVKTLGDTERETIIQALDRNRGKRKRTAEELNISERTLYRKIKEYGLEGRNTPRK